MAAEKSQKREWPFAGVWGTAAGPVVKLDLVSCACGGARTCILCALARRHLRSQLRPWVTRGMIQGLQPLEAEVPLPDQSLCFQCHIGWSDDSTGPLLACKGSCNRAFHAGCRPGFDDNQHCTLCSGEDEVVCGVCRREWSDPSKQSDYYTGEMVVCDGGCNRAFHQSCHTPPISDAAVASDEAFICTDCIANPSPFAAGNTPAPALAGAATAGPVPAATADAPVAPAPATCQLLGALTLSLT